MGIFALVLWLVIISVAGLLMVFVQMDENSPFYKIKSFAMSEEARMQEIGRQVNDFLQVKNTSKYISLVLPSCGGLGNMFYRFLSIYGIGRNTNRIPFIEQKIKCFRDTMPELEGALPNLHRAIKFMRPNGRRLVDFGHNCCKLDNVSKLERFAKDRYVIVRGTLLQAFGYFHRYKDEIRYLLTFSDTVKNVVDTYVRELFGTDNTHKFCVHTRLGDFRQHFLLESTFNFSNSALEFTARYLKLTYNQISLVFLGLDKDFMRNISVPPDLFKNQYMPKTLNRTSDLYLGSRYCDSLLMTASGSTFAWWMSYLMSEHKQHNIFYNIETAKKKDFGKNIYNNDTFLSQWNPLRLFKNGSVGFEPSFMILDRDSARFLQRQMIRLRPYMVVTILLVAIGLLMLTMDVIRGPPSELKSKFTTAIHLANSTKLQ